MFVRAYCRASTSEQDADRAKNTLKEFAAGFDQRIAAFYTENKSGNLLNRPELMRLLDESDPGDVLLVESVDRLTRLKEKDWDLLVKRINDKNIRIVSLDLPTSHLVFGSFPSDEFMRSILRAINNMLLEILAASAYKEYQERERKQKEGIEKAQRLGKYKGRQPNSNNHARIKKLTEAGFSIKDTYQTVGVSRSTVVRVRKELKLADEN